MVVEFISAITAVLVVFIHNFYVSKTASEAATAVLEAYYIIIIGIIIFIFLKDLVTSTPLNTKVY